jgi:1-aminocyclopropane-1-carboxylate deaminase
LKIPDLSSLRARIEPIDLEEFKRASIKVDVLREDSLEEFSGGNKLRKLVPSLLEMKDRGLDRMLSFGGAYSNHIAALAEAGELLEIDTVGIIRGEELIHKWRDNPTLRKAHDAGMTLEFVSREAYREKESSPIISAIIRKYLPCLVVPEGGTHDLAIKGCETILDERARAYNYIAVAVGTGGTLAGMLRKADPDQQFLGFSALASTHQIQAISGFTDRTNFQLYPDSVFGGYGRIDERLVNFMNDFHVRTGVLLDPVYTGKMMYQLVRMVSDGFFPENSRTLVVHTGGIQGITGMNEKLSRKGLPLID